MEHCCEECLHSEHIEANVYLCKIYERVIYADDGKRCCTYESKPNGEGDQ